MTIAGHVWAVGINLIIVSIVLMMFSETSVAFETMAIAGGTLIYVAIGSGYNATYRVQMEAIRLSRRQFVSLVKRLHDPDAELLEEASKEADERLIIYRDRIFIDAMFHIVLVLIAVYNIVSVLDVGSAVAPLIRAGHRLLETLNVRIPEGAPW